MVASVATARGELEIIQASKCHGIACRTTSTGV